MKIASWNVNSLKVRLDQVLAWCETARPDVLALQETKLTDDNFPTAEIENAGYHAAFSGQPTYNGVAILSRLGAPGDVVTDPPGVPDEQRRIIAATVDGVRLVNLYVVNGQAVGTDKYDYKLDWLARVTDFIASEMQRHEKVAVVGDFNIAPEPADVHDPDKWEGRVLFSEPEREALKRIMDLGLVDSFRLFEQPEGSFSWWDYRAAAFRRGMGLRIDLVLASRALADRCTAAGIDVEPRREERPSDHAPVWAEFK
jgi:exodeoxyribonuclease-3